MSEKNLYRADIARGLNPKGDESPVDRNNEIIKGCAVLSKGEAKGHSELVDGTTLDQCVKLGNELKMGLKSRFGHPNMSARAMGTHTGRLRSFWLDEDVVRADLHIDPSSHSSPEGDIGKYVMDLAESDPDAFGLSIAFTKTLVDKDNKPYKPSMSEGGDSENQEDKMPRVRIVKLYAGDVVDEPAANEGLFNIPFFNDSVMPSAQFTTFLDNFLANENAVENVINFLSRYQANTDTAQGQNGDNVTPKSDNTNTDDSEQDGVNVYGVEGENYESFAYPNEHACRHVEPGEMKEGSFRRVDRRSKEFKKSYSVIMGRLKSNDKMVEQAYRYNVDSWSREEASKHCSKHKGIKFEPAQTEEGKNSIRNITNDREVTGMSEVQNGNVAPDANTQVAGAVDSKEVDAVKAQLSEREAELETAKAKLAELAAENKKAKVEAFIAEQKQAGRVLPKFEEKLSAILLGADEALYGSLTELVKELPKMVEFDEKAKGGSDVDQPTNQEQKHMAAAEKYARDNNVSFEEALIAIDSQGGDN